VSAVRQRGDSLKFPITGLTPGAHPPKLTSTSVSAVRQRGDSRN